MKAVWKVLRLSLLAIFLLFLAGVFYLSAFESYIYLTRSDAKAEAAAQAMFVRICEQNGLDPASFQGPERRIPQPDEYNFVWARLPEENISVSVIYLPYDLPYSLSDALVERKRK